MTLRRTSVSWSCLALVGALSCSHRPALRVATTSPAAPPGAAATRPVVSAARYAPPAQRLGHDALRARLPTDHRLRPEELLAAHTVSFGPAVTADPDAVDGMRTIQGGPFALRGDELSKLRDRGFAVLPRHQRNNFLTGYVDLYVRDQPVYLSADVVLNALHEGFDTMIATIESDALRPALTRGLERVRTNLAGAPGATLTAQTRADLDAYVAVALGLLQGAVARPAANADATEIARLHALATAAEAHEPVMLFGSRRDVDFSQMRPRGHYLGVPEREQYFRAVMWLGREGLRLIDVVEGHRVLNRRDVAAALALRMLADGPARQSFALAEEVIAGFAGEPEALTFADLDTLADQLSRAGALDALPDARVMAVIDGVRGDRPRVATAMLHHPDGMTETLPMPVPFSLTPQRYTPDSMVLSRVSFDRVNHGRVPRMMPDALDAAFAALGNDQAADLLRPQLAQYDYATELETSRALVDAHEASFWQGSLYASWMSALRTLSPRETLAEGPALPEVMRTEPWGRRLLNTQLAAWAELRHDTVLYTAQSYSASLGCSYPSAYVEPYPALWSGLSQWVDRAHALLARVPWTTPAERDRWNQWTLRAGNAVRMLGEIATRERAGEDLTSAQLEWVNHTVTAREENHVCTTEVVVDGGWLYDLYEPRQALHERRDVVADVHTQPSDEVGNDVGRVLHIGTGRPQAMAVIAGPPGHERAYLGYVSTYLERTTEHYDRLDDTRWREEIDRAQRPEWMAGVSAGQPPR